MDAINAIAAINNINAIAIGGVRPRRRKLYKPRLDPFRLCDLEFRNKYRFTKETIRYIVRLVDEDLTLDSRGCGTPTQLQVLIAIRCWGRREVQDDAGDLHGLSQATVSRICARVARALARHSNTFIRMPTTIGEEERIMRDFQAIRNFPGVIGAIDGTHIKIKKCGGDLAQYYINRKGFYSLNIQAVCDANLRIRDLVARWRGSTHDSRIFNESVLKERFDAREFRGRLLGDSGYELQSYLFTPLSRPQNDKEERYNVAHIATRNTIERCYGVWKQRFRCLLHGLPVSLQNAKTVIVALAVLHNISIDRNDQLQQDIEEFVDNQQEERLERQEPENQQRGRRFNQNILQHFIANNF